MWKILLVFFLLRHLWSCFEAFAFFLEYCTLCPIFFPPPPLPLASSRRNGVSPNHARFPEHHLYTLVAKHLLAHPTTPESPLRLRIHGMPPPTTPIPAPAVPRGWKMSSILPLHSPALSGGGVSENILQDMMAEMQGAGAQAAGSASGGSNNDGGRALAESGPGQGKRKRERDGGRKR